MIKEQLYKKVKTIIIWGAGQTFKTKNAMESKNINCFRFDMKIKYVTYITRISGQLKRDGALCRGTLSWSKSDTSTSQISKSYVWMGGNCFSSTNHFHSEYVCLFILFLCRLRRTCRQDDYFCWSYSYIDEISVYFLTELVYI